MEIAFPLHKMQDFLETFVLRMQSSDSLKLRINITAGVLVGHSSLRLDMKWLLPLLFAHPKVVMSFDAMQGQQLDAELRDLTVLFNIVRKEPEWLKGLSKIAALTWRESLRWKNAVPSASCLTLVLELEAVEEWEDEQKRHEYVLNVLFELGLRE